MSVGNAIIGVEEQLYVSKETVFGVFKAPTGADAVRIINSGLTASQERVNRKDKRNSRSISDRITRKKTAEFSLSMYLLPSGTAGTPPDIHHALEAAFGTYANSAGVSDTYSLARDINSSFTISRILGEKLAESFVGCVFDEIKIKFSGEDEVMLDISGFAKEWIRTTPTTLAAAVTASAQTFTVVDADSIEVGSMVAIGADDNGLAGFEVLTYDVDTKVATMSAAPVGAGIGDAVIPFLPAAVTSGQPLGCFPGTITLDGIAGCFSEFEVTLKNNINMRDNCFGSETAVSFSATTFREVTFSGTLYMDDNNLNLPALSEKFETMAIIITAGDTAGERAIVTLPTAELNLVPYEIPDEDEVTYTIEGQAIAPDTAESEITMVFN